MQVPLVSNKSSNNQHQANFGSLSPMKILRTVDKGLLRASAYVNGLEKEAISLVNPQQSKFSYFIKREAMSYLAPIVIPIRRMLKKANK